MLEEPKHVLVMNAALEKGEKDIVIHIVEELSDVCTPEVTMLVTTEEELSPIESTVKALALATRPGIVNEASIVEDNEFLVEESMYKTITEGSDGDHPAFIVGDGEGSIGSVTIRVIGEITVQPFDVLFERIAETLKFRRSMFSTCKETPALPEFFD